jgi:hypothetical protein
MVGSAERFFVAGRLRRLMVEQRMVEIFRQESDKMYPVAKNNTTATGYSASASRVG